MADLLCTTDEDGDRLEIDNSDGTERLGLWSKPAGEAGRGVSVYLDPTRCTLGEYDALVTWLLEHRHLVPGGGG